MPDEIQRKVIREIEYISNMERDGLFDDEINVILDKVSRELKYEVMSSISLRILRGSEMLSNAVSV